jgi:hypothetical protein
MPATTPVNTPRRDGEISVLPIAATTTIYAGTKVGVNASGYAVPAGDIAGLKVVGVATQTVTNAGAAGAATIEVRAGVFQFASAAAPNAVTIAHIGGPAYAADDMTVSSDPGDHSVVSGEVISVETTGVWIDTTKAAAWRQIALNQAGVAANAAAIAALD